MTIPADVTEAIYALISAAGRARMYAIEDDGLSPARARKSADSAAAERTCRDALVAAIRAHLSPPLTVGLDAAIRHVRLARVTAAAIGHSADYMAALDRTVDGLSAMRDRGGPAASKVCELATPPLTVGAALARPEVRLSGSAIEVDCPVWGWTQIVVDAGVIAWRTADTDPDGAFEMWPREWLTDEMRVDLLALPCRLVPADEADLDPTTRSKT